MKIKEGFMLREIAGQWVVVPLGSKAVEFNCILMLSGSGALLWETINKGADEDDLVKAILNVYDIDEETARADVKEFIMQMEQNNLLE